MNSTKLLQISQLDKKLSKYKILNINDIPQRGWIRAIRTALNMSMKQLGKKLGITAQSVKEIEEREQNMSITLKSLKEAGETLNLKLVYGFVPLNGSLKQLVEKRALALASEIIQRTSKSMELEDQKNTQKRLKEALHEKSREIYNKLPKYLWD